MEQKQLKLCLVGIQTFSKIRENNYLYIDKTGVYLQDGIVAQSLFLPEPPATLRQVAADVNPAQLFRGAAGTVRRTGHKPAGKGMDSISRLHFDMSMAKHMDRERLERYLGNRLAEYEETYGIDNPAVDNNDRLTRLIQQAYHKTGRKVVVLINEYDAPLLDVVHEDENLPLLRSVMRNFYSPLKACDPYLRFVFLTGITKFSQLSIFSELNNISNISMFPEYAGICGITKEEMLTQMSGHIDNLAMIQSTTRDKIVEKLTEKYNGYHFTWPSPDIFNPFSIMKTFAFNRIKDYWFESGTPTYLIEMLRKYEIVPSRIGNVTTFAADFDAPTENLTNIVPLLYQSGYLTIKDYNEPADIYTLDIPNTEIRMGLMNSLLPNYTQQKTMEGRVDMVMRTATRIYVIELKINKSAEEALEQIDMKNYPARFALYKLPVVKVGINFSLSERTITEWKIEG